MSDTLDNQQIAKLVSHAQTGDRVAQNELIAMTQSRLFKFCLLLGHNKELAEDLCQETYIKAFANIKKINNPETFVGWIYQIAKNLFIDKTRSPSNKKRDYDHDVSDLGQDSALELVLNVQKVLMQFEPEEKTLLLLIELEGYSYKEAGEIVGMSEDAVRSKLHRLRSLFIKNYNSAE